LARQYVAILAQSREILVIHLPKPTFVEFNRPEIAHDEGKDARAEEARSGGELI
jgi:hypothetical protein